MKSDLKKSKKLPKRSEATADLLESIAEMESYVKRGMTIQDMKRDMQQPSSTSSPLPLHYADASR